MCVCRLTVIVALALRLPSFTNKRNRPQSFYTLVANFGRLCNFLCGVHSITTGAREERAVNAVVSDPIPSGKFLSVYKQRRQGKQLAIEFKALAKNQEDHTTSAALRNVLLNVKQEVVPYDHSRIIVWDRPETLGTDYYNASFIDGYNSPKEYIASQGPSSKCLVSFWHMVWQEGVTCIVMATGLFENAVQQCDKYWVDHTRKHAQHGHVHLWHERSTYLAQLNIRTFRMQKEGSCESRLLTHYEMVGFHDECPDPGLLLDVRRRVNSISIAQPGPVLVHCRCGGGRTAVYVAVDFCLHQLHSEDRVDVYSTVLHLRRFRKNMVRTLGQYKQIYNAVAMYIQCGMTVYPADTLPAAYQVHYAYGGDSKHQRLEREFQTLQSIVPRLSIGDCASGHRVENRSKSRDIMMLPPECARPYLTTADCGDSGTDFINAVYIDGYHLENTYLVTQWPMKRTTGDLWRLMYDFRITSLVFMNDPHKFTRSYPRFWPKEIDQTACYGPISVRYLSCERKTNIVIRTFAIRKIMNNLVGCEVRQDEVIVKMFQVLSTGRRGSESNHLDRGSSPCAEGRGRAYERMDSRDRGHTYRKGVGILSRSLLAVIEHVLEWQKRSSSRQPICVISKDGSSRVGLYCAISVCCDQVRVEREVDVFNAVRLVRKNRPQLVPTLEEYRYIYRFMTEFILLSGSKPEISISEPPNEVIPRPGSSHRSTITPTPVSSSLHGGVYVIATGKGSDALTPRAKGDNHIPAEEDFQARREAFARNDSKFLCISHPGRYHTSAQHQDTGVISQNNDQNWNSGYLVPEEQSQETSHICNSCSPLCSSCAQNKPQDNGSLQFQCKKELPEVDGKSTSIGKSLTNGQILSSTTLQPLGDIHQTPNDSSVTKHGPDQDNLFLSTLNIPHSSTSLSNPSFLPSPYLPAPSPGSFLTPESCLIGKLQGGLSHSLTSASLSPGSLCRSASFFSCNSHLSLSSNNLGNSTCHQFIGNGGIPSSDLISSILHRPASANGNLQCAVTRPDKLGINNSLIDKKEFPSSQASSGLLQPDLSHFKVNTTNSACDGEVKLIHASYASLDDSLSGSLDDRDHYSSLDWVEHDGCSKTKPSNTKLNHPHATSQFKLVLTEPSPLSDAEINQNGEAAPSTVPCKNVRSAFKLRQKIRGYKKKIKKINSNLN